MIKDTSGPAFPFQRDIRYSPDFNCEPGMTLRQWYAGLAMQALLTNSIEAMAEIPTIKQVAYAMADAMLAEDYIQPWIKNPDMEVQNVPEVRKDES